MATGECGLTDRHCELGRDTCEAVGLVYVPSSSPLLLLLLLLFVVDVVNAIDS